VSGRLHQAFLVALGIAIGLMMATLSASAGARAALADLFGPNLIRAQVVIYNGGQDSEIYFSRGRISAISTNSITLREKDGQIERLDVAPGARVTLGGSFVALSSLRRGMQAQVFRPGDAPANRIDASVR
jgi:hypothetical protein